MTTPVVIETELPEDIFLTLQAHGVNRSTLEKHSRQFLALNYFQDRTLSLGKAAKMAGMNYWEFIEFLGKHGVPVIDYSIDELEHEFKMVEQLAGRL